GDSVLEAGLWRTGAATGGCNELDRGGLERGLSATPSSHSDTSPSSLKAAPPFGAQGKQDEHPLSDRKETAYPSSSTSTPRDADPSSGPRLTIYGPPPRFCKSL